MQVGGLVEPREPMADRAQALVATSIAPFVYTLRGMTPLDIDTAVGAIFVVCAVVIQIGLFALARAVTKAPSAGTKPAAVEKAPAPLATPRTPARAAPVTTRVERDHAVDVEVSGFAWMRAAGITPHDEVSGDPGASPGASAGPGVELDDLAPDTPGTPDAFPSPLSPFGRAGAHYSKLTPAELQRLREFRALVQKAARAEPALLGTSDLKRFANDACLCRYLRARGWNLKKALKMFSKTARWRAKTRPERIRWRDVQAEGATGKQYVAGTDKEGRSVLVMRPGRENSKEHAGNIRFLIYTLERATWREKPEEDPPLGSHVEHHREKLVLLIDFTGWTLATAPPMRTSRETLSILQDHFPERLAMAVLYNPPWIFAVFWKAISPFIDPETYRKIRFVNPKREKETNRMRRMFRAEQLDRDMGGERDPAFDLAAFAAEANAHDRQKDAALGAFAAKVAAEQ